MMQLIPSKKKISAIHESEVYVAVRFTPPKRVGERDPLSISVALDNSGSMIDWTGSSTKMAAALAAVSKLIDHLGSKDKLSIISFNYGSRIVLESTLMNEGGKAKAYRELTRITAFGGTNIGDGLITAARCLNNVPGGRIMIFTDGEANAGITDMRTMLNHLSTVNPDCGVSTFGFGMTYNASLLSGLAEARHGSHYYLNSSERIAEAFGTELGSIMSVYATDVKVQVTPSKYVKSINILNPLSNVSSDKLRVTIPRLFEEQTYDLILKVITQKQSRGRAEPKDLITVESTVGQRTEIETIALELTAHKHADTDHDASVMASVAVQLAALAQKEAIAQADTGDVQGARQSLLRTGDTLKSIGCESLARVVIGTANSGYTTEAAYATVGQKLSSTIGQTFSAQTAGTGGVKVDDVDVDSLFANETQKSMRKAFSITKTGAATINDMPDIDLMITP